MRMNLGHRPWPGPSLRALACLTAATVALTAAQVGPGASVASADACPNAQFRAGLSAGLPDCRAYELVSNADSHGTSLGSTSVVADEGGRVLLFGQDLGEPAAVSSPEGPYVAERGSSGWSVTSMAADPSDDQGFGGGPAANFSRYLWSLFPAAEEARAEMQWTFTSLDGSRAAASPLLAPLNPASAGDGAAGYDFLGGSEDLSEFVFYRNTVGTATTLLPGDPATPASNVNFANLYEVTGANTASPALSLVQRGADGTVIGGVCGAGLGGLLDGIGTGTSALHAVSADGSVVYFNARPAAPSTGTSCPTTTDFERIFKNVDGTITQVSQSQCDRTTPACSAADGNDTYQDASVDGSRVFFTSTRQLTDSDLDTTNDLYLYDSSPPAGQPNLVQVSAGDSTDPNPGSGAGVLGVVLASTDGSRVYFVATGALTSSAGATGQPPLAGQDNLYVYERDASHPTGRLAFIAPLLSSDSALWTNGPTPAAAVPSEGTDAAGAQTGGDGHLLIFKTAAPLAPDDTDAVADVYRYDDDTGELLCISCSGNAADAVNIPTTSKSLSAADYAQAARFVTEDGSTIVFDTSEALLPEDQNAVDDVYEWHDGELSLISGGTGAAGTLAFEAISANGDDIVFDTTAALTAADTDTDVDVYDARVDGGFPAPVQPPACDVLAGGCQSPARAPSTPVVATPGFSGPANTAPGPRLSATVPAGKVRVTRTRVSGTSLTLTVKVPAKGTITVSGADLAKASKAVSKAGSYRLRAHLTSAAAKRWRQVVQRAKARRRHAKAGHARPRIAPPRLRVRVKVNYKPATGKPSTATVSVELKA